jgi:hypothetical protein
MIYILRQVLLRGSQQGGRDAVGMQHAWADERC